MKKGTVKEYDRSRGFGFVTADDSEDYFVHVSGLRVDLQKRGILVGQRVMFDIQFDVKGDRAVNVRLDK